MTCIRMFAALIAAVVLPLAPARAENYAPANQGTFPRVPSVDSANVLHFFAGGSPYKLPGVQVDPPAVPVAAGAAPAAPAAPAGLATQVAIGAITVSWSAVAANPVVTSYIVFKDGANTPLATLPAGTTHYADGGIESGTNHSYAVFAANAVGTSPYTGSIAATAPFASSYATQYPAQIGSGGGASAATAVAAQPARFMFASYGDAPGFNAFTGLPANSSTLSVHGGHANLNDWQGGVGYWLGAGKVQGDFGVTGYPGPKMLSLPLVYHGPNGAQGELLASAAAGNFDAQYQSFGAQILAAVDINQPINHQVNIYIRMGEEFNAPSSASNDWAPVAGNEPAFVGAFDHAVTNLRAAEASYTPIAGHAKPHMIYVWCMNLTGSDPRPSYPGDAFVDVVGNDVYVFPQFGDSLDPDTQFANLKSSKQWGLDFTAAFAAAHNKPVSFPEVGVALDNYGQYYKLFYNWMLGNNVAYLSFWNNNGDYAGQFSDGTYPQTGAMLRHLINPAAFPVEPIPAPTGVTTSVGNGTITVSAVAIPSSANVTSYSLYEGSAAGAEALSTPVASGSAPTFTVASPNGAARFFKATGSNAASVGFLSAEVTAAATPPASNTPAHYLAFGSAGYAATPVTSALVPGPQNWSVKYNYCITNLVDANRPGGVSSQLAGMWASSGYLESVQLALNGGNLIAAAHDGNGNTAGYYGAVPFVQNGCYTDETDYSSASGTTTLYHDTLGAGTTTLVGSISHFGNPSTQAGTPVTDPGTHVAPDFRLGQSSDGTAQFTGLFVSMVYKIGGTVVLSPTVGADGKISDPTGAVWTISPNASVH